MPLVKGPVGWEFGKWCDCDLTKEPLLPIDVSKSACDDPVVGAAVRQFSKQHPGLDIIGFDGSFHGRSLAAVNAS